MIKTDDSTHVVRDSNANHSLHTGAAHAVIPASKELSPVWKTHLAV